jgi:hypothetical protein
MRANLADMSVSLFHLPLPLLLNFSIWCIVIFGPLRFPVFRVTNTTSSYLWTFPLRLKSDVFLTLTHFHAYAKTQFNSLIRSVQCDNGGEFDNTAARTFFLCLRGIFFLSTQPKGRARPIRNVITEISLARQFFLTLSNVA